MQHILEHDKNKQRCGEDGRTGAIILTITVGHIQSYIQESRKREDFLLHLQNGAVAEPWLLLHRQ